MRHRLLTGPDCVTGGTHFAFEWHQIAALHYPFRIAISERNTTVGAKEDKVKGKWEEAKGKGKKAWGDITEDPDKVEEGSYDELKGKGRQKLGDAKEWVDKKTDE
jgi:uncharacterized protein YjbJ (UPF0337 family)